MQLNATICLIIALALYFIVPVLLLLVKNKRVQKWLILSLFLLYLIFLLIGVFFRVTIKNNLLKITLDFSYTATKTISFGFTKLYTTDVLLNLVMLMPIGYIYSFFSSGKTVKKVIFSLVIGLCIGLIIETGQFFLPVRRSVQLSDVIINGMSLMLGTLYIEIFSKLLKNKNIMI